MDLETFKKSIGVALPSQLSDELSALWHAGNKNWHEAHEIIQEMKSPDAAWIHAWLHREEGDLSNATYWYRIAERPVAQGSIEEEWEEIVSELLRRK